MSLKRNGGSGDENVGGRIGVVPVAGENTLRRPFSSPVLLVLKCRFSDHVTKRNGGSGDENVRRLALFVYLNHSTKNDVTSGKKER